MTMLDVLGRPLRTLRLSVTDHCNLRCSYCMPEDHYAWLPREDLLTVEEIVRLADVFIQAGVTKVRVTGGEPLLRPDLPALVASLCRRPGLEELALTTNGVLLGDRARELFDAGLRSLTVSLDTLDPARFAAISRRDQHGAVLHGLEAARAIGFPTLKLDCVVVRGTNDDELEAMLGFARALGAEVRFIEYMDVAGATRWTPAQVVSRAEMLARISRHFGPVRAAPSAPSAPAERFHLEDGTTFGIIASVTAPFCRACDRSRVSADGQWFSCLYALDGLDLRGPLRAGQGEDQLLDLVRRAWTRRADRGAELRAGLSDRRPLLPLEALRADPHREMHTRGG